MSGTKEGAAKARASRKKEKLPEPTPAPVEVSIPLPPEPEKPIEAAPPEVPKKIIIERKVKVQKEVKKEQKLPGFFAKLRHPEEANNDIPKEERKKPPFSETHHAAYSMFASVMPKLHSMIIGIVLIYLMLAEMSNGNYDFLLDWYNDSVVLPIVVGVMIDSGYRDQFFTEYGAVTAVLISMVLMLLYLFYKFMWRLAFKDYILIIVSEKGKTELTEVKDGRCYWHNRNMWCEMWYRVYGCEKPPLKVWIHQSSKFWFNLFMPANSCVSIDLHNDEWLEARGVYQILGHERPRRVRIGRKQYETTFLGYTSAKVPLQQASDHYDDLNSRLVMETRELTKGNATLRLEQMRDGGFILNEKVRRVIVDESKQ